MPLGGAARRGLRAASSLVRQGILGISRPQQARGYWRQVLDALSAPAEAAVDLRFPDVELEELIASPPPVDLVDYRFVYGDVPLHELLVICQLAKTAPPEILFEIGTYQGATTLQLAANTEAEVYTLDLPKDSPLREVVDASLDVYPDAPGSRFATSPYVERIHQLYGDSQTFDYAPYVGRAGLVFVDACHHYEAVRRDSEHALSVVAPGGRVVWHDCAGYAPGVVRALNELSVRVPLSRVRGTSLVVHTAEGSRP